MNTDTTPDDSTESTTSPDQVLNPLEEEQGWVAVDPNYTHVLRIQFFILGLIPTVIIWLVIVLANQAGNPWLVAAGIVIPLLFAFLLLVFIPRKVKRIKYLVRSLDVNLRHGLLWYTSTSVANNRIQHIEVTQGPLERIYALGTLALFTAGGMKSDLKIPGLQLKTARQLKSHLLQKIGTEEFEDDDF